MSVRSAEIIDLLPSLRRYALALIGDPLRADAAVELTLEQLLADQAALATPAIRVAAFRRFERCCAEAVAAEWANGARRTAAGDDGISAALERLPPEQRKALLLVGIEGFSHAEAGAVLGLAAEAIAQRVLAAREALRRALSLRVLVIEDEPMTAMSIAQMMTHMGHAVCGIAQTQREAVARAQASTPSLILADVRLRDGDSGIATVRAITRRQAIPVIFITGHASDLVSQDLRPALVVGKPFAPHTLEAAVRRVLARLNAATSAGT